MQFWFWGLSEFQEISLQILRWVENVVSNEETEESALFKIWWMNCCEVDIV